MRSRLAVLRFLLPTAVVLVILLVSLPSLFAQDTPPSETPSPTLTATDTPSETPEPTASDTATYAATGTPIPPATATDIPAPTDTFTLEPPPSDTATAIPTELPTTETAEVTAEAPTVTVPVSTATTLPPEPPLTLLFQEDFADQDLSSWALGTGWSLTSSAEAQVLSVVNSNQPARLVQPTTLYNVVAQAVVQFSSGTAITHVRQSGAGQYTATLALDGTVTLARNGVIVQTVLIAPGTPDSWRTLRLSVIENVVRVAVDGTEVIVFADLMPLPAGEIAFAAQFPAPDETGTPSLHMLAVNQVSVWVPQSEFANYTATPIPTDTSVSTLLSTPTEFTLVTLPPPPTFTPSATIAPSATVADLTGESTNPTSMLLGDSILIADGDVAALSQAILDANANCDVENPVTIELAANGIYDLTTYAEDFFGETGLPVIRCALTIVGNGATIQRSASATDFFRLMAVDEDGDLTLENVTLRDGDLRINNSGGALLIVGGRATLWNVHLLNNQSVWTEPVINISDGSGGALYNYFGILELYDSTLIGNHASTHGGAILTWGGSTFIGNTDFLSNTASGDGGALYNYFGTLELYDSSFDSNTTVASGSGGAIFNADSILDIGFTTFTNNHSANSGSALHHLSGDSTLSDSCIAGNLDVAVNYGGSGTLNAANNWWGAADGPSGAGPGSGDSISAGVIFDPFLTTPLDECELPGTSTPTFTPSSTQASTLTPSATFTPSPTFTPTDVATCDFNIPAGDVTALRNAIVQSNTNSDTNVICLAGSSTYTLMDTYEGDRGLPWVSAPLIIRGNEAIIERGETEDEFGLLQVTSGGELHLFDLTLRNGRTTNGGAVRSDSGMLTLTDVSVINNQTTSGGGGIYALGTLIIDGGVFSDNLAAGTGGGGINLEGGSLQIRNSRFERNVANWGGGIRMVSIGPSFIQDTVFIDNQADPVDGGAIFNQSSGMVTLTNVSMIHNTANGSNGGGIFNLGSLTIEGSNFSHNVAGINGGAILHDNGTLTIRNSHFESNAVNGDDGGGIRSLAQLAVESSAFIANTANRAGGGLAHANGSLLVRDGSFVGNSAAWGGGINVADTTDAVIETSFFTSNAATLTDGGAILTNTPLRMTGNCLTGNLAPDDTGTGLSNFNNVQVDALNNWWGSPEGPNTLGADTIYGENVVYIPFLTTTPESCSDVVDSDGDGLSNDLEVAYETDPFNPDTDGDGLSDGDEVFVYDTEPTQSDTDGDGLNDGDEVAYNSNPHLTDSDGDGLLDGFEVHHAETDPTLTDSDGNGVSDGNEDLDGDGLSNLQEQQIDTHPLNPDTDGNGVADGDEDFDADGLTNLQELSLLDGEGNPLYDFMISDSDGNGVPDGDEDPDADGLTNEDEYTYTVDPLNSDTDGDRLPDGFEVNPLSTDPASQDSDGDGFTDDHEDPDTDGLNNYQEWRLGTDPLSPTTLGAPSRLHSETILMPASATADGVSVINVMTIVRDAQGRFLPNQNVIWSSTNPNLVLSAATGVTGEEGVAIVQVTSAAVTSGVVEIRAADIVVGRPVLRFIGGDPTVRFIATSPNGILPGQVVNAVFEVSNDGVLPIANVEVVANLPFGVGVIEAVETPADVELRGQGSNAATWNIPTLEDGFSRRFVIRFRAASTLGLNAQIPLTVQTSAIEDTNSTNNSATSTASIVPSFIFPATDQQTDKLAIAVTSSVPEAAIGETIDIVVTVENISAEPIFNVSGFAPLLGNTYPNVAFTWNDPSRPGYLAPAGNGAASQAVARIPFTLPENYPVGVNRLVAVQAVDNNPEDGSIIVVRDSLTDAELSVRGPNLITTLTANRASATDGEVVTFTLTVTNSAAATDTATNLQVTGNLISGAQALADLPPGTSTSFPFTYTVTLADAPQITAQLLLTGNGQTQTDVLINRTLRRTVSITRPTVPGSANLAFTESPSLAFLPGRITPIPLTVINNGGMNAENVQLRLNVPFGIEPDLASLGTGNYDSTMRVITWELGTLTPSATQTVSPAFLTPANAALGTGLVFDATLATTSDETTFNDNVISPSGVVALPAPTHVTVNPTSRNWLIADNRDEITLAVQVLDQLGAPLPDASASLSASLPGVLFDPVVIVSDTEGRATTTVRATQVGAVDVIATFANGVTGSTTLNRRDSAVSITHSPASIGVGGQDQYTLFVVNTATLPDGTTATGDLVDLSFTLPPELSPDWFQFAQPTLPLGFGDFTETSFTVTIPPASALPNCTAIVGTFPFTVTATGRTLGVVGQAEGQLTIVAQPPEVTDIVPDSPGRIGGDRVLFGWRSNTPGESVIYYRRVGEATYTALTLDPDPQDPRQYSAELDIAADPEGTDYEWYGEISNGCSTRTIDNAGNPFTFTRVRSTTFVDPEYEFTIPDGYNVTTTTTGTELAIRVRNDDDESHAILLDVENPYDDLIIGFTGSGSVDQVIMLAPGQNFSTPLRVFTQDTERVTYPLMLRLENDEGDVDRVPLILHIHQPQVELDLQVLNVDPRTLVTTARLTNLGDTLTDLTLDIVQDDTGIPANFVIQPDIQHTYLLAGQSLEIAFIPLDLEGTASASANMSTPLFDPLTGTSLSSTPTLLTIPGPYRVIAKARNTTIPNVTLRDGTLTNVCGADGSDRTVVSECTVPAGNDTRVVNGWYCTNRPNIDVPISLALPNGGLGVPITNVSVGANFSPGSGVYTHSTTVSLNGSLVGSAVVPSQSRIQGSVAPQALILGGSAPTQLLNLRSTHTNGGHYVVASGFTVTVEYDEHTRTGCFTPEEVAGAGGDLICTIDPSLALPNQSLGLRLDVDRNALTPEQLNDPYTFTIGEQIPLIAEVAAAGMENINDPVQIELTVPRGLRPQGMTIQGEDQTFLDALFALLNQVNPDLAGLVNDILGIDITDEQVVFTYETSRDVVIGQPFPITLDVVGEVAGEFTLTGEALISEENLTPSSLSAFSVFSTSSTTVLPAQANVTVLVEDETICEFSGNGIPFNVRSLPRIDATVITSIVGNRTVFVMGYVLGDIPPGNFTSDIWWLISFGERDSSGQLIAAGYAYSEVVFGDNPCASSVSVVPEVEIPPPPPPGICQIQVLPNSFATIYGPDLTSPVNYYSTQLGEIGSVIGDQENEASLIFPVYGLHISNDVLYYLLSPVGEAQPDVYAQAFPSLPGNPMAVQNWVNASFFSITSPARACDESALGRIPSYFLQHPEDVSYRRTLAHYMNAFFAPVNREIYLRTQVDDEATGEQTYLYNSFRVSQRPHSGHWAIDVVFRPPDGRDNNILSQPFPVYAPASGIIVDVGYDGITGTDYFTGPYSAFPTWVTENCPVTNTETTCNPTGRYLIQFFYNDRIDQWQLMVALMYDTDNSAETDSDYVLNSTGEPPSGILKGASVDSRFGTLVAQVDAGNLTRCSGDAGCADDVGQQIVIWYEAGDGDSSADIETAFLHVNMNAADFATWKEICSMRPNGARTRIQAYNDGLNDTRCQIAYQQLLGEAQLIGFTTGTHLHYQMALDSSDPDTDADLFTRPYNTSDQPGEWVDPVVSYDMHMPPGRGGQD